MIWRDSRGRFVRTPSTAIRGVIAAVYPTRNVAKVWSPVPTLTSALENISGAIGSGAGTIGASGYTGETRYASPISYERLADLIELSEESLASGIDLAGARLWLGVRLQDGRVIPITKAYTTVEEVTARAQHELRTNNRKYLPDTNEPEELEEPEEPEELPPEPIRYAKRDARGRFTK